MNKINGNLLSKDILLIFQRLICGHIWRRGCAIDVKMLEHVRSAQRLPALRSSTRRASWTASITVQYLLVQKASLRFKPGALIRALNISLNFFVHKRIISKGICYCRCFVVFLSNNKLRNINRSMKVQIFELLECKSYFGHSFLFLCLRSNLQIRIE